MGIGLMIFGAVVAIVGLFLWMAKSKKEGKSAVLSVTETSTVSEINENYESMRNTMGAGNFTHFCEVKGAAHSDNPLTSELAKEKCVYYSAKVVYEYERLEEKKDAQGKITKDWVKKSDVVSDNTKWADDFGVKDSTGFIFINPAKAELHAVQVHSAFEKGEPNQDSAIKLNIGGVSLGLGSKNPGHRTIGYRYTETAITLGKDLYVIGDANDKEGKLQIAKPADKKQPFIVSTKSESELAGDLGSSIKGLTIGAYICWGLGAGLAVFGLIKMFI